MSPSRVKFLFKSTYVSLNLKNTCIIQAYANVTDTPLQKGTI